MNRFAAAHIYMLGSTQNRNKPFRFFCNVEWKNDSQSLNNNDMNLHGLFEMISKSSRASSLENLPTIGYFYTSLW